MAKTPDGKPVITPKTAETELEPWEKELQDAGHAPSPSPSPLPPLFPKEPVKAPEKPTPSSAGSKKKSITKVPGPQRKFQ